MAEATIRPLLRWRLGIVVAVNLLIFLTINGWSNHPLSNWADAGLFVKAYAPGVAVSVITVVLNGMLAAKTKARLVYLKWTDPLPGSQAFTDIVLSSDERISVNLLRSVVGDFPTLPREQNALWYRLYRQVEYDPSVSHVHREYLLTRDWATLSLFFCLGFVPVTFINLGTQPIAYLYAALLCTQVILTGIAARNYGRRFVTTVLARASSAQEAS